jgi:hypothetical protein
VGFLKIIGTSTFSALVPHDPTYKFAPGLNPITTLFILFNKI